MNDWSPMDEEQSQLQIHHIADLLTGQPKEVIDIGCGDGRLLLPLSIAGHQVIGIDINLEAIESCKANCKESNIDAQLLHGNVLDILPLQPPVDAIICCGQTLMLFAEIEQAIELFRQCKNALKKGGVLIIDDIPGDLWREVAEGRWSEGINSDKTMQMVWSENDTIFAIREGDSINDALWELSDFDRPMRLWTMGALKLLAVCSNLSVPEVSVEGGILVMRPN
tara:strand:- start:40 stop:711 length:672 start_codon:yes stop_codon:yes gene_type:complete